MFVHSLFVIALFIAHKTKLINTLKRNLLKFLKITRVVIANTICDKKIYKGRFII